jgi:hypothetical protein
MPLARYDLNEQCWKTSVAISLWALTMSSLTLPPWGCLHDGELYELPTPERPTIEPGYSSLPTPRATSAMSDPLETTRSMRHQRGYSKFRLEETVAMLPTPRAMNGQQRNQTIYMREGPQNLENALALLPTPAVNDMGAGKDPQAWTEWAARQKAADGRPAPHGKSLEQEALKVLATPTAGLGMGGGRRSHTFDPNSTSKRTHNPAELVDYLKQIGATTHQPSTDGKPSLDAAHQPQLFSEHSEIA